MGLLDKLDSLVKAKVHFKSLININSNNDNRQINLHIGDLDKLSPADIGKLRRALVSDIKSSPEYLISSEPAAEKVSLIGDFTKKSKDDPVVEFIKKNLPAKDCSIWFSALMLKEYFEKDERDKVKKIKEDIRNAHQERGNNIANLCSTGYLETLIIPLHNHLVGKLGNQQDFNDIYEKIVTEMPLAVFVNQYTSEIELKKEIINKISRVKEYGWNKVNVHSLGIDNVKKTKVVCAQIESELEEIDDLEIRADKEHITATFFIK